MGNLYHVLSRVALYFVVVLFTLPMANAEDTIFFEGFEEGRLPTGWSQEYVKGNINWKFQKGGHRTNPSDPLSGHPQNAYEGNYNALFHYESLNREATKLITKRINLEYAVKPELRFWHVQDRWFLDTVNYYNDRLKVFYKTSEQGAWNFLDEYNPYVENWTQRFIQLPDNQLSNDFYIGFEGTTYWGWGTGIDNVMIVDTGKVQRVLNNVFVKQASTQYIPVHSINNPVIRVDFRVIGNEGDVILDSIRFQSLNTDNSAIDLNGVRLYHTRDSIFSIKTPVGTGKNFTGNQVSFTNLGYKLPTGYSSLWLTYDIKEAADPGGLMDAKIPALSISVNGQKYPATEQSPPGNRRIIETIFFDNFEDEKDWDLTGEFEIDSLFGLGGQVANPDPLYAFSGVKALGTDLRGLGDNPGDYEKNLTEKAYTATSPPFNCFYYKNVSLSFQRHLNIDNADRVSIDYSIDNGESWVELWHNNNSIILDNDWRFLSYPLYDNLDRQQNVKIRYTLGPSNNVWEMSGWNIDDVFLTGDYVARDVGVTEWISPLSDCGRTSSDSVRVRVKNFGPETTSFPIPVVYSLDNGQTIVADTIHRALDPEESFIFTFKQPADLSSAGFYNSFATTTLPTDDDKRNDSIQLTIFAIPTYQLPYLDTFEDKPSLWVSGGENSSWQHGKPNGAEIRQAFSGINAWVTDLDAYYHDNENSHVISPCFDFTQVTKPLLELQYFAQVETETDGAAIEYSLDGGESWVLVPKHGYPQWDWNWYNNDSVNALGHEGWGTSRLQWTEGKQFLPNAILGQSNVRFRVKFASNEEIGGEGFAFDDVRIYDAPHDLGVVSIDSIFPLACQYVNDEYLSLAVKNFGVRAVQPGEKVRLAVRLDNGPVITDTITMLQSIPVNDTLVIKLTKPVDFTIPGNYLLKAWAIDDIPGFYTPHPVNDTSSLAITIVPLPVIDLGDTIFTARPDTVVIRPPYDPDFEYLWQDGFTGPEYHVSEAGNYSVAVTHTTTHCEATDSLVIVQLIADYGVSNVISPASSCYLGSEVYFEVEITNAGTDTLKAGGELPVGFVLQETQVFRDTLVMTSDFEPGESRAFTLNIPVDLTLLQEYNFNFFTAFPWDSIAGNDSLAYDIEVYGFPDISLGPDTVVKGQDFYILDPGQGYDSYLWQDGAETSTYVARGIGTYWVQVTDINGCSSSDTVFVHLVIHDISPVLLVSPVNSCDPQGPVYPKVLVVNTGTDTLAMGEIIPIQFKWNQEEYYLDTLTLAQELKPNDGIIHTFDQAVDISQVGKDTLIIITKIDGDIRALNDTLKTIVEVYQKPVLELGANIVGLEALEYLIEAPQGFSEYLWHDESIESHFLVNRETKTFNNRYTLTVTDANGCKTTDNKLVSLAIRDLEVTSISFPAEICQLTSSEQITVRISNKGTLPLSNVQVRLAYKANTEPAREQVFTYTGDAGTSRLFTFNQTANLSAQSSHSIRAHLIELFSLDNEGNPVPMTELDPSNDTIVQTVNVLGNPVINFGESGGKLVVALPYILDPAPGYAAYLWQDNSQLPTYNVTNEGTYTVRVTSTAGCVSEKSVIVERIVGLPQAETGNVLLYPNPAEDRIWLKLDQVIHSTMILEIVNANGSVIRNDQIPAGSDQLVSVTLDNIPSGMYYLKLYNHDVMYTAKFVVK
jgi:hypothetical protein